MYYSKESPEAAMDASQHLLRRHPEATVSSGGGFDGKDGRYSWATGVYADPEKSPVPMVFVATSEVHPVTKGKWAGWVEERTTLVGINDDDLKAINAAMRHAKKKA